MNNLTHLCDYVLMYLNLQLEFAVQMSCSSCADKILDQLNQNGISKSNINISYKSGTVTVNTDQPSSVILNAIEKTGSKAVLKGYGSATRKKWFFFFQYFFQ